MNENLMPNGVLRDLRAALVKMTHSEIQHYVTPGLSSKLVGGGEHGKIRFFVSDRDTREWITPHSHRFDFTCLVLRGRVENILFQRGGGNAYCVGTIRPKDGGLGGYEIARGESPDYFVEVPSVYEAGQTYSMSSKQIHSIRFSRDAEVLFFEGPQVQDISVVLEPWSNGAVVPTFSTAPWMFQRPASS